MSSHQPPVTEQIDDPESGWTWFLSLASMIVFTVTVVAVAVLFFAFEDMEIEDKVIDVPAREVMSLREEQNGLLDVYETYSVIPMGGTPEDAETRIRIPIEQAMEVQVAESLPDRADRTGVDRSSEVALLDDDPTNMPEAERR